jgi:hypothetical protein
VVRDYLDKLFPLSEQLVQIEGMRPRSNRESLEAEFEEFEA